MKRGSQARLEGIAAICSCQCPRLTCFKCVRDNFQDIASFMTEFSAAPKVVQDLVFMLQTEHVRKGVPLTLHFFGTCVSRVCLAHIMMLGPMRLQKLITGTMWDMRSRAFRSMGTDLAPQREACNLFLLQIYIRLGETLPDAYFQKYAKRRQHRYAGIDTDDDSSGDDVIQDSSIVIIIHIHMMIDHISHNQ